MPKHGELLVKIVYLSLDPAMRGWMNEGKSYIPGVGIGDVMRALALGRVIESKDPKFTAGDYVVGAFWRARVCGDGRGGRDESSTDWSSAAGVFGNAGDDGHDGVLRSCSILENRKRGDTVVVSGAAGAVGGVVGQIAKIKGCRAVGIAGGAAKCEYIAKELGFDAAIDYKKEDVRKALQAACPKESTFISTTWAERFWMRR